MPTIERFIRNKDSTDGIFIQAELKGDYWLDYKIWEVTGINEDDTPFIASQCASMQPADLSSDDDILLSGFIKWDGCMQWNPTVLGSTWFHADGREQALTIWNLIINSIYDLGKEFIPQWSEE